MTTLTLSTSLDLHSKNLETGRVAILMCTYNGGQFLSDQLNSIEQQSYLNWKLVVSDDGSQDETLALLEQYKCHWGDDRLEIMKGPKKGFASNFLSLTCNPGIKADFFAWSDQDDIWGEDKIQAALDWLNTIPSDIPALYCGRTQLINEAGIAIGHSPLFTLPPHFSNALVQSIAGGNTMVFNQAARKLLCEAGSDLNIPSHDWWAYQLITGIGGTVHYDPQPKMQYRQHNSNIIGSNSGLAAYLLRWRMVLQGRFYEWNERNIYALETIQHLLCKEHQNTLLQFKSARNQKTFRRLLGIKLAGLYRQTLAGNLGLLIATLLKKI